MRTWQIGGFGLDRLELAERRDPDPGPGAACVRVRAVGLNYRDLLVTTGQYDPHMPLPRVPGSDMAGEVEALGSGVEGLKVGDRVAGCFMPGWIDGPIDDAKFRTSLGGAVDGVLCERIVLPAEALVPLPAGLSFEQAACLPCAGVTAWNALGEAATTPGETVLIQGTGGVSVFALQFAAALGLRPLVISSSDAKLERARALGAAEGLNYRERPEWHTWCREMTGGAGVDHVVEVGGAGTLERSFKAARHGGHVALIGVLSGTGSVNPLPILMKSLRVRGIYVGSRAMFDRMNAAIERHQIRPVVDKVFGFEELPAALSHLQSASHFGKVVVSLGERGASAP